METSGTALSGETMATPAGLPVRVVLGDATALELVWRWAGIANVAAVLAFAACAVRAARS
ncbi:hypothetical protein [Pseudosporangium ferrugineum]|uniref:Uncharacterized protein n=1 Tax=Pseudosporangium ferrugineum TaxID=439699 RepID=A0A2T0SB47_9ACTN|nr:hypothetical protein [Pseudosporangium ferrugineum]PRY30649.1 hypothetical protein CLV70_104201 [Pseudosporangium ferrugineum]